MRGRTGDATEESGRVVGVACVIIGSIAFGRFGLTIFVGTTVGWADPGGNVSDGTAVGLEGNVSNAGTWWW
jgi:hypothetical protein